MNAGRRTVLMVAWLVAGGWLTARGQQAPLPNAPIPLAPGQPGPQVPILGQPVPQVPAPPPPAAAGGQVAPQPQGQPFTPPILGQTLPPPVPPPSGPPPGFVPAAPPGVPAPLTVPPAPGPAPMPDPGRDGWATIGLPSKPEGLFLNVEVDVVRPSVHNKLSGTVVFPSGMTDTLHVPQSSLTWTASPDFEIGYRLADSLGDFLFGYRFIVNEGRSNDRATFAGFVEPASIRSRLDVNEFDLDYVTATYSPLPRYDLKFRFGARAVTVYLDSQASNAFDFQESSSYFTGAGPSATLDFERRFRDLPELGLFVRTDGAVLIGRVQQKFRETLSDVTGATESAFFDARKTQTSEQLRLQVGFIYHPFGIGNDRLRIAGGYQFERWWGVGKINGSVAPANVSSDAEVTDQGIFLRAEYDF